MMYDDVANDPSNPFPGQIINKPGGKDVYGGVVKDYTLDDVNKDNFLKILQGNKAAMKNIGSGKVIESGPNDHIFINFVDHGATGFVCFPNDNLYADELISTLKKMASHNKFKKMLLYIEACEAGSMFENILPNNIKIVASTASNADESSWGCYCDEPEYGTCLGDLYSVTWMEHLDAISPKKEKKETILSEYKFVKHHVNLSHVMLYGDKAHLSSDKVKTFLGVSSKEENTPRNVVPMNALPSREIAITMLKNKLKRATTFQQKKDISQKLAYLEKMRAMVDQTMANIVKQVADGDANTIKEIKNKRYPVTLDVMPCYKRLVQQFTSECIDTSKNDYALRYVYMFLNMCSMDSAYESKAVAAFSSVCTDTQRTASGIV